MYRADLTLLLVDLQSPINIGMILRVAETYRVDVAISGSAGVLDHADKMRTVSDFGCGALERAGFQRLGGSAADVAGHYQGRRTVATSIQPSSVPLSAFAFQPGDVVLLGNEYDGLPDALSQGCAASLRIPMADVWTPKPRSNRPIDPSRTAPVARDGMANLNVAIAAGIICYQWFTGRAPSATPLVPG